MQFPFYIMTSSFFRRDYRASLIYRGYCDKIYSVLMPLPSMFTISGDVLQEDIRGFDYKGTNTVN